jgi:hypothetical protein
MRWYQAVCSYESGHDDEAMELIGEMVTPRPNSSETHQIMGLITAGGMRGRRSLRLPAVTEWQAP